MPQTGATSNFTGSFGVVAMAAYRPNAELLGIQLRSIQQQTHTNFRCIIAVDGGWESVAAQVAGFTDGDERFEVLGFDDRLGFYGNFERALGHVGADARWVALSDQDDAWHPDKLARMIPLLDEYTMVAAQARVIEHPSGRVVTQKTDRRDTPLHSFIVDNQYTGGMSVFRKSLLHTALPFPRLRTPSEVHDHWLAVCSAVVGRSIVIDQVVQDYVQHGANVIGEVEPGFSAQRSVNNALAIARKYEGSVSLMAVLRTVRNVGVGWRTVMVDSLRERLTDSAGDRLEPILCYGSRGSVPRRVRTVMSGHRRQEISTRSAMEYLAGIPSDGILRVTARLGAPGRRSLPHG